MFEDIAWSTPTVLTQSCDRAAEIGLPVTLLPMWYDVDDAASLAVLEGELAGQRPDFTAAGLTGAAARHTRALLVARIGTGAA